MCATQCAKAEAPCAAHIVATGLDLAAACVKVVRDGADPTAVLYRQLQQWSGLDRSAASNAAARIAASQ